MMLNFEEPELTLEDNWRSIILYGRNSASYKFALGKCLLDFTNRADPFVSLEELAIPFSKHLCEHLKMQDRQGNSDKTSLGKTISICRDFNKGKSSEQQMHDLVVKEGFNDVIRCFHRVNKTDVQKRFYIDERSSPKKGITLTSELFALGEEYQFQNLISEVESRWRLVETAWRLNLPRRCINVYYDDLTEELFTTVDTTRRHRYPITKCRSALIGYHGGECFYCKRPVSLESVGDDHPEVDHFLPHRLMGDNGFGPELDLIWNLVLSCEKCNRGEGGKSDCLPNKKYLQRLYERNESFTKSTHPLSDTIKAQTGKTEQLRRSYLDKKYREARFLGEPWESGEEYGP
jgi:5-methylcytosine-specific restriction endonuclease McrA